MVENFVGVVVTGLIALAVIGGFLGGLVLLISLMSSSRQPPRLPSNDLFERLRKDPDFGKVKDLLRDDTDPRRYVGRAPEQVDEFLRAEVDPVLHARSDLLGGVGEVSV